MVFDIAFFSFAGEDRTLVSNVAKKLANRVYLVRRPFMKTIASYQIVLLGARDGRDSVLVNLIGDRLSELGLNSETIGYFDEPIANQRSSRIPTIAVFFGYDGASDSSHPEIKALLNDSSIVITLVSDLERVHHEIPLSLHHINAIDAVLPNKNFDRVTSLILEGFRLLRRERRLFISYKRKDSQALANQLYDALDSRGFDVFIDTRSVPPSADFQAELWHRLSDSDIVVLIDTPLFRQSRWTTEELARANATNIQILHLLWPDQPEDDESSFSHFHALSTSDFTNITMEPVSRQLNAEKIEIICAQVEKLRARAIAARYRYLVDGFCDAARDYGLAPSVQPQRWISLATAKGKELAVVPTIGVPTSERINQVFDAISKAGKSSAEIWVLYDNRGLLTSWLKHLDWLDSYLPVRSIKMSAIYDVLKGEAAT